MTRMRTAFVLGGATLAAVAVGSGLAWLFESKAGARMRRRRAWELMVERAAGRAMQELKKRRMVCVS